MCIVLIGLWLLLLYYAHDRVSSMQLSEQIADQTVTVALGWELVTALWPLSLLLFVSGVLSVLLTMRVRSMLRSPKS